MPTSIKSWFLRRALLFCVLGLASAASAQEPNSHLLTFTGTIPGQPDGPVAVRLRLFPRATGEALVFEETQTVTIVGESFTARIGEVTVGGVPARLFRDNASLWIAFAPDEAPDAEIGLRTAITSGGYAHAAAMLSGPLQLTAGDGVTISGTNSNGRGVQGTSTREIGVFGVSETGPGVSGISNSGAAGDIAGVQGMAFGTGGKGVFGLAGSGPDGTGVVGRSTSGGRGVYGESTSGSGVEGHNTFTSLLAAVAGVKGTSTSDNGTGVWGDGGGRGLYGFSRNGSGVVASGGAWAGFFDGRVAITGSLELRTLGAAPGVSLCRNDQNVIANCSSSLRYKTDVHPFSHGLDIINRLRPIVFSWKQGGMRDVGLAAEDVEQVEPLLTFRNDRGEIEGVKYNQLSAVFVNAFAEQQAQIERQQAETRQQQDEIEQQRELIREQRHELTALKALVCLAHPEADACR